MSSSYNVPVVTKTNFAGLKLINRGKVRDIYDFGEALLIVATDRLSAYDVIMEEGIPSRERCSRRFQNIGSKDEGCDSESSHLYNRI